MRPLLCIVVGALALRLSRAQDILHRSPEQKQDLEDLYRRSLHKRLDLAVERGYLPNNVDAGWGWDSNWSDLWGPTYTCPSIEHIGKVGDGGKWICGVDQLLRRQGCVIYSLGSFEDYEFEAEMLNRTSCDIHVFDPTVLPSKLREREAQLNAPLSRRRIWWHSIGIAAADNTAGQLGIPCYGGRTTTHPMPMLTQAVATTPPVVTAEDPEATQPTLVANGLGALNTVWQPRHRRLHAPEEPGQQQQLRQPSVTDRRRAAEASTLPLLRGEAAVHKSQDAAAHGKHAAHRRLLIDPNAPPLPIPLSEEDQAIIDGLSAVLADSDRNAAQCAAAPNAVGAVAPAGGAAASAAAAAAAAAGLEPPGFDVAPFGDIQTYCDMRSLPTIMQEFGHTWLDVFKIDVEGSEYETFAALSALPGGLPFTQLQVEVHFGFGVGMRAVPNGMREQFKLLLDLMRSGMRTMFVEPNIYHAPQTCMEFAMLNVDACGNVVTPAVPAAGAAAW